MIIRFTRTVTLASGNEARNFRFNDCGYGRVTASYEYTDRRRSNQVSRRYTVEFLNGKVESITARSAWGGRVETFKTSTILAELLDMLSEFLDVSQDVAQHRYSPAKVEAPAVEPEQDNTDLRLVGMGVVINMIITLATLGIVWCNL